ncbi:MAG: hypothetical protein A2Y33_10685 [Spirochaetes bacterium GWF1_51_8]|nr:MAG: hypothetical protein A2Y33_10685 [Spirochaetes bacterium GWF1_51_8]
MTRILFILLFVFAAAGYSDSGQIYSNPTEAKFYNLVTEYAKSVIGLKKIPKVGKKGFTSDCIGFVNYAYYKAGIDLQKVYANGERGVDSLYNGLQKYKFVYDAKIAKPGDIIFFDNTYDVNKNKKWDDPLSHVGIVDSVGKHGTITYIHFSSSKGVAYATMNLYYPKTHAFVQKGTKQKIVINSYLRKKKKGEKYPDKQYISAFFYRSFAHIKIKDKSKPED